MKTIGMAGAVLLSAVMIAGAAEWVTEGKFSASSTYGPNTRGNVFDGGHWCGAKNWQDWIQLDFTEPVEVSAISIGMAGTDITTQDALITIKLQGEDGAWVVVDELKDTNVNYEELTDGRRGNSIPAYRQAFEPMRAKAFRLELVGHGWFRAEDIRIWRAGAEVSVEAPATEEAEPGAEELSADTERMPE